MRHFDKRRPLMFTLMKLLGMSALSRIKTLALALEQSRQQLHLHLDGL